MCSLRFPDAPPRQFLINSNERCLCKERLADNSMCPHEIRVYGFDKSKFEERHFRRLRAKGSLTGWTPSSETKSLVDSIIEFEPEEFETSAQSSLKFSSACPPLPPLEPNSVSLPPGFIPDKSIKVRWVPTPGGLRHVGLSHGPPDGSSVTILSREVGFRERLA